MLSRPCVVNYGYFLLIAVTKPSILACWPCLRLALSIRVSFNTYINSWKTDCSCAVYLVPVFYVAYTVNFDLRTFLDKVTINPCDKFLG